jgi:hypothetical protein
MTRVIIYLSVISLALLGCKGNDPDVINPYDTYVVEEGDSIVQDEDLDIDPTTIQGLHKNIFSPTCANSGCHDGNFEPDFRTIESSYNTLVNQPLIKNDEMNPLTARVTPGNSETSMIIRRLKIDLNGNSGTMPLVTEPGTDWFDKKDEYIDNIETWINNGALNQLGDSSTSQNFPVQLVGVNAMVGGQIASRSGTYNPIQVPKSSSVEIWLAFKDDGLPNSSLSKATINYSLESHTFDSTKRIPLQYVSSPVTAMGYYGEDVAHYYKAMVPLSTFNSLDVIWLRSTISDGVNDSELPNDNSIFRAKQYTTIRIQ